MAQVEPETMLGRDRGAETEDMDIEQPVQESHAGKPTGAVSELSAAPGPTAAPLDVAVTQDSAAPAEGHVQDGRTMTNVDSTEASTAQDEANAEGTAGDSAGRRTGQSLTPPHEELLGTWIDSKYFQVFSPSRRGSQPSLSAGDQPSSMEEQPRAREAASPELAEGRLASENVHDNALPPSTASGQFLDAHDAEEMVISRSGDSSRARSRSPPKRGGSVDSIENESSASASYLSMPLSPDGNIDSPSESAALFDDRAAGLTTQVEEAASEKSTSEDVEKRFFQSGAVDGAEKGARGPG